MGKLTVVAAFAAGYVLGARAGRDRYEQIKTGADKVWGDPRVQEGTHKAEDFVKARGGEAYAVAKQKAGDVAGAAKDKVAGAADDAADKAHESGAGDAAEAAKRAAGAESGGNEGPDQRQPAPPQGL